MASLISFLDIFELEISAGIKTVSYHRHIIFLAVPLMTSTTISLAPSRAFFPALVYAFLNLAVEAGVVSGESKWGRIIILD
jgi:hypothetical protein